MKRINRYSPEFSVLLSAKTMGGVDPKKFGGEGKNGTAIPYLHTMFDGDERHQTEAAETGKWCLCVCFL